MGRTLILGGGVAGLATAWALARRGTKDVLLLERESGLARHSSRKNAAILRTAVDDPLLEDLARRGAEFLRSPPQELAGRPLLERCGVLIAAGPTGSEPHAWEERALADARAQELDGRRLASIAPHFSAAGMRCLWFPEEGRIDLEALLGGLETAARRGGVRLETCARAKAILTRAGAVAGVRLEDGREIRAEKVLIAAGGWAGALASAAGSRVRLRPTLRHLVVTEPDARVDPRGPVVWAEGDEFYARPDAGGLLLCACDVSDAEPDEVRVIPEVQELALAKAARWLPGLFPARVARSWSGVRTMTSDGRFAIGPDPDVAGLFWAAGLGGHGMMCGAVAGELAAAALLGEAPADASAAACDPARLAPATSART